MNASVLLMKQICRNENVACLCQIGFIRWTPAFIDSHNRICCICSIRCWNKITWLFLTTNNLCKWKSHVNFIILCSECFVILFSSSIFAETIEDQWFCRGQIRDEWVSHQAWRLPTINFRWIHWYENQRLRERFQCQRAERLFFYHHRHAFLLHWLDGLSVAQ